MEVKLNGDKKVAVAGEEKIKKKRTQIRKAIKISFSIGLTKA